MAAIIPLHLTLLPLRLVSESNQREHWTTRHRRRKAQRETTYYWLRHWMPIPPPLPLTITLTRVAPRMFDSDGLVSSVKACQDACADWLCGAYGKGQDRQVGLTWIYRQRRGEPHEYAVEISVERRGLSHAPGDSQTVL